MIRRVFAMAGLMVIASTVVCQQLAIHELSLDCELDRQRRVARLFLLTHSGLGIHS
jgi:hypothetical protein